jgi:hypothetical protein
MSSGAARGWKCLRTFPDLQGTNRHHATVDVEAVCGPVEHLRMLERLKVSQGIDGYLRVSMHRQHF